jgi:integrase/recombinase XerD
MKKSFSILIILRKEKQRLDGSCPLNVQVTINSKVWKLPISQRINPKFWDAKNHCCIGKGFGELNIYLDEVANRLRKFCLSKIINEEPLNIDLIRDYHNGVNLNCFFRVFDRCLEGIKNERSIGEETLYKYDLLRRNLKQFKSRIDVTQIDKHFVGKFKNFLYSKGSGKTGTANQLSKLDAIINEAFKQKLMKENPLKYMNYKVISKKKNFLTYNELLGFERIDVSDETGLKLTKDRFLFACYTGFAYVDVNKLKKKDINLKKGVISIMRQKTKVEVNIPLNRKIKLLILRYFAGKDEDDLLFPSVSNQNDNRNLKVLGEKINLNFGLCFHDGRHTFGSLLVNHYKIPLTQVKELMGHSDISITAGYANTNLGMLKEAMNKMN